jgi:general secretion pathway protein L
LVPGRVRLWFRSDTGQIVFDISGDKIVVDQVSQQSHREIGRISARPDDPAVEAATLAPVIGRLRMNRYDVVLRIPAAQALRKQLIMPRAAIENLRQVLAFEMDRQTPFSADKVYYDFLIGSGSRSSETIDVELVACPKADVDAAIERARAWRIQPGIVDIAGSDRKDPARINLLPNALGRKAGSGPARLTASLAFVAVLLGSAALYLQFDRQRRTAELMQAEAAKAKVVATAAAKLRENIVELSGAAEFLAKLKHTRPRFVETLDALTQLLPDDTWLQQLQVNGDEIRLTGYSAAASNLIGMIEQSEHFTDARFRSSVTRDARSKAERFTISVRIVMEKQP